jgi:hypothetical protein
VASAFSGGSGIPVAFVTCFRARANGAGFFCVYRVRYRFSESRKMPENSLATGH